MDDLPSLQRWGAWTNTDPNTYDVERVEVMRGPQGTLFGSGSLGGALRVISNKPDTTAFAGNIELTQAFTEKGEDSNSASAMLNIPLVDDSMAMRLVAYRRKDGGYIDNVRRNEDNVNSGTTEGGRLLFAYAPSDRLDLRLTVTHQSDEVDDGSATFTEKSDGGEYEYNGILAEESDVSMQVYNFWADYDLGSMSLISSTTIAERESVFTPDLVSLTDLVFSTGLDPDENDYILDEEVDTLAQEFRLTSQDDSNLKWTVGAFYFKQEITSDALWTADNLSLLLYSSLL